MSFLGMKALWYGFMIPLRVCLILSAVALVIILKVTLHKEICMKLVRVLGCLTLEVKQIRGSLSLDTLPLLFRMFIATPGTAPPI